MEIVSQNQGIDIVESNDQPKIQESKPKRQKKVKVNIDLETKAEEIKITGDFKNDIAGQKPLFKKGDSVDKMEEKTFQFIGDTSRRIFSTAEKEEQEHLNFLLNREYYPLPIEEIRSERELVGEILNVF